LIEKNLAPVADDVWNEGVCRKSALVTDPYDDVMRAYYEDLNKYCHHRYVVYLLSRKSDSSTSTSLQTNP